MNDCNDFEKLPGESNCCVSEERFPAMRECCVYSNVGAVQRYQCVCHYCNAWTLPPTGESLEVATIFECKYHGYCKRVKE